MAAHIMRVSFLSNYPVPYQAELLRAIADLGEIQIRSYFLRSKDPTRSWPEERSIPGSRILPSVKLPGLPEELRLHPTLFAELWSSRPDLTVVCGYSYLTLQAAMAQLIAQRRPWVLWAELPRFGEGGGAAELIRRTLIRPIGRSRGVIAVGRRAASSWREALGGRVPVTSFPYVCDLSRYLTLPLRGERNEATTFLFCAQLVARKGPDVLIEAFQQLADDHPGARLLLAGEGPERSNLERLANRRHGDRIEFLGFQSWEDLPRVYGRADVMVLPSRHDGWGLVVNEALAAGLPVISTTAVGAALDLIVPEKNGWLVEPGSVGGLLGALKQATGAAADMHLAARDSGSALALDVAAKRFGALLEQAAGSGWPS